MGRSSAAASDLGSCEVPLGLVRMWSDGAPIPARNSASATRGWLAG